MTRQRSILLSAAAAVALAGSLSLAQEQPTTTQSLAPAVFVPSQLAPAAVPTVVVPVTDLKSLVEPIQRAADPSAAISAYARASSAAGNHVAVQDAYVRKMVEFNLPEMAESQAKEILKQDGRNDVAIAVVSYMQGRRGQAVDAIATIVQAVNVTDQPTAEPFVLRTAGQLVAWYDTRADKQKVPDALRNDVEAMRRKLSIRDEFGLAYAGARDAYLGRSPGTPDVQPQQAQGQSQIPAYTPSGASTTASTNAVDYQPQVVEIPASYSYSYAEPYYEPYYYPTYYSSPFLYSSFYYGRYYDPCYSSVIIHDRHHHRDGRHGDHDGHHGGHDGHHGDHGNHGGGSHSPPPNAAPRVHRFDDVGGGNGDDKGRWNASSGRSSDNKIVWSNPVAPTQAQIYQNHYAENRSGGVSRSGSSATPSRATAPPSRRVEPTPTRIQPVRTAPTPSRSVDRPSTPSRSAAPSSSSRTSSSQSGGGGRSSGSSRAR